MESLTPAEAKRSFVSESGFPAEPRFHPMHRTVALFQIRSSAWSFIKF